MPKSRRFPKPLGVPKSPKAQLRLLEQYPPENPFPPGASYRMALAEGENLSEEAKEILVEREASLGVLLALGKRFAKRGEWEDLEALYARHPGVRWRLALDLRSAELGLPKPIRDLFLKDPDPMVRKACAEKWSLTEEEEALLAQDPDSEVRRTLAPGVRTQRAFSLLLQDGSESVRENLGKCPLAREDFSLFRSVFASLGETGRVGLAWWACRGERKGDSELHRLLAQDPFPSVRSIGASCVPIEELMRRYAHDPAPEVRRGLAMNPHLPEDLQSALLLDLEAALLLARNPALSARSASFILEAYPDRLTAPLIESTVRRASAESVARFLLSSRGTHSAFKVAYEELARRREETPEVEEALARFYPLYAKGREELGGGKKGKRWIEDLVKEPFLHPALLRQVLAKKEWGLLKALILRKDPLPEPWFRVFLEREEWVGTYAFYASSPPPPWFVEACMERGFYRHLETLALKKLLPPEAAAKLLVALHRANPEDFFRRAREVLLGWWEPLPEVPGLHEALLAFLETGKPSEVCWALRAVPDGLLERIPESRLLSMASAALDRGDRGVLARLRERVPLELVAL